MSEANAMGECDTGQLTQLMAAASRGERAAQDRLWRLIYDELHQIAGAQMGREQPGRTLQTTALIHEAYLRLTGGSQSQWANRGHFFAAAAEAMRRIRVDDARKRGRIKRGGGQPSFPMIDEPAADDRDATEVLAVNDALAKLEECAPRQAEIVKLRYFAGLTGEETAEALGVSPRTVDSDWRMARAWLHRELGGSDFGSK